jgi:hypothetical protein
MIDTAHLTDVHIVACTLYGEARSESTEGILAVACVIRNRVMDERNRWPKTYREVCLQPKQFSCWSKEGGEGNHAKLAKLVADLKVGPVSDARYKECAWIATGVVNHWVRDTAHGADHYHTKAMHPRPPWAHGFIPLNNLHPFGPTTHFFYKLAPLVPRKAAAT